MKLLRNPEFIKEWIVTLAVTVVFAVGGFFIHPLAGVLLLLLGLVLLLIRMIFLRSFYRKLAGLSDRIDRVLHGQEEVLISESHEGELAILTNEIEKMTIRLRDQAEELRSDKLHLTEAIQNIFHQIRTPLTSIQVTLSLLEAEDVSAEERIRLTRTVKRQAERIHDQVEALLNLSRMDAGTVEFRHEVLSVKEVCNAALDPLRIPLELREITLRLHVSEERFTGDRFWTAEALGNLFKNALEHGKTGGILRIAAAENPLYTELVIEDDGEGFSEEDLPHLFERFYKGAHAKPESMGIGLALTRMILAEENGTIQAENRPEGGARFTIRFYKGTV